MSSRTTTPSAVGRTQRRRPAACFLSVARWPRTVVERVGERLGREAERVEQAADPLGALGRRHADLDPDPRTPPAGRRRPPRRGAGRRSPAAASTAWPERVAEVQGDPAAGRVALALVGDDDLDLGPGRPARRARRARPTSNASASHGAIAGPSASSSSNSRSSPSAAILTASPRAARSWRSGSVRSTATSMIDRRRLVERPDEVLALGQVDAGLAADRRVDLGDERRRDLDERDAAQVRRGEEPGRVAERAAADRDERLAALDPERGQLARRRPR